MSAKLNMFWLLLVQIVLEIAGPHILLVQTISEPCMGKSAYLDISCNQGVDLLRKSAVTNTVHLYFSHSYISYSKGWIMISYCDQ